ncbi:TPA: nucleotide exchange factor GrpE [Candidatus Delongbacteria bacterium]|nr:MAG: nucleotide exchange factor GrpE [Candidatus Delongbacteria bacterium GWF2_40_14]HAQ61131.1 nucleotide exchange factor GrpE [Candidatus Delongbacteria bacterium]
MTRLEKSNKDDLDINKSEIFNSDYYFDDIIEELSESGLYSESEIQPVTAEENAADLSSAQNNEIITSKIDDVNKDINLRIQKIEQRVLNANEMLFNTKNELVQSIQKIQNSILLMKFETEEGINKLSDLFKEKFASDCVKEKAFDELYTQLESYKRNFVHSALKPFVHDLLLFYDRLNADIEHMQKEKTGDCAKLTTFKDEILEILYRNDIMPVEVSAEGSKFNPEKSNAVDKFDTEDVNMDNTVKKVLRIGFKRGNASIRPELVQIYKLNTK